MQFACLNDLFKLSPQADQLVVDGTSVCLDLGFARTANKPETAPLTFQVGPCAHQTRALIAQRCHLDLQNTLTRARSVRENLKDQSGSVEKFDLPGFLKIALLNRRNRAVDQYKLNLGIMKNLFQFFNLSRSKQISRLRLWQPHNHRTDNLKLGQCRR